jgi:hypothetical protein
MKIKISSSPLPGIFVWGNTSNKFFSEYSFSSSALKCSLIFLSVFYLFVSDITAQNFFPLKVGNAYQVKDDWWWAGPGNTGGSGTYYYNLIVLGDTIINGDTFFTLLNNNVTVPFNNECLYRYDSLQQKLFIRIPNDTTTRLAVDFNAPNDSSYISYIRGIGENYNSYGISYNIVLGDTQAVYTMEDPVITRNFYQFSDQIGFKQYKYYYGWNYGASSSTQNVISAIIDSVIYNPLVLKIDSLYPVFDRPVDTFPYLLTIPYTSSYPALVDSFYLDVEQLRADTLIQIKKFNLSKNNPSHLTLYLDSLQVGDKIKLRATITDTSIYNNVDHYPDAGWVVMNVLPPILYVENNENPMSFELAQNYPNPFNPITTLRYQIPEQIFVVIKVFDILGNIVEKLVDEEKTAGSYAVEFDGSKLSSGIYYYQISTAKFHQTRKMVLIK